MSTLSYSRGPAEVPLLDTTIGTALRLAASRWADGLALVSRHQGLRWTWAELDAAVDRAVGGILDNAGQVCNAGSRLLVHRSIHDRFVARFVERAAALYQPGDPLDPATTMGPLANPRRMAAMENLVADARQQNAQIKTGGQTSGSSRGSTSR